MSCPGVEQAGLAWLVILSGILGLLSQVQYYHWFLIVLLLQLQMGQSYIVSSGELDVVELYDKQRIHPSIEYVGCEGLVGWIGQFFSSYELKQT